RPVVPRPCQKVRGRRSGQALERPSQEVVLDLRVVRKLGGALLQGGDCPLVDAAFAAYWPCRPTAATPRSSSNLSRGPLLSRLGWLTREEVDVAQFELGIVVLGVELPQFHQVGECLRELTEFVPHSVIVSEGFYFKHILPVPAGFWAAMRQNFA